MHGRTLLPLALLAALAVTAAPAAARQVTVTADDSGSRVTLRPGDRLRVVLDANPTTGYRWVVARRPDRTVARVVSSAFQPPAEPLVGAGGTQVSVLRAVGPGTTRFALSYRQVGSGDLGAGFALRIRVRRLS
jgi:inhibitor of cysteine peptidase